jgi:hypothetical protein
MSDLSPWKALFDKASDIITAASHNPLGIVALVVLLMFIVGYIWFSPDSTRVRIGMFLAMIASALVFFLVGLHGSPPGQVTKETSKPKSGTGSASAHEVTYVGRVQDRLTLLPVQSAKAEIDIEQKSRYDYTDSNGIYRVKVNEARPDSEARLQIQADGYRPFDLHLDAESATSILPVRLDPSKAALAGSPATRKATYLGRVLDEATRSPVVGAKVVLGVRPPAYTDNDGVFWFDLPTRPKGPVTIRASAQGYENHEQIVLPEESAKPIDIRLVRPKGDTAQH